jgi:hypothetical protein
MVFSFCIDKKEGLQYPYLWRSYSHEDRLHTRTSTMSWHPINSGPAHTDPIWQVARATSAAPRYFESIKAHGKKFLDGGMCANNPSLLAIKEVRKRHGDRPALFLSIGTGLKTNNGTSAAPVRFRDFVRSDNIDETRRKQFLKKYLEIGKHWKEYMTDPEGEQGTDGWLAFCDAIHLQERYRLNVRGDMADVPLDDWRPSNSGESTLQKLEQATEAYLSLDDVKNEIDTIARSLVEIRRRRAETERWEVFALDLTYRCPEKNCKGTPAQDCKTRDDLRTHLMHSRRHQPMAEDEREAYLDRGRRGNSW